MPMRVFILGTAAAALGALAMHAAHIYRPVAGSKAVPYCWTLATAAVEGDCWFFDGRDDATVKRHFGLCASPPWGANP